MRRDNQSLCLAGLKYSTNFNVATALRDRLKAEIFEYLLDFFS